MFMKTILNIPDVKKRFIYDQLGLLKDIIRNYLLRIPFQSVTSFGSIKVTANGRPPPTLRDIISNSITGRGGFCSQNNYFLRLQLESIGYDVTTIAGCFRRAGVPLSHCMTVVKVKPDRKSAPKSYLVDVGCGVPLQEPVPLFDLPYRSRAGGLNFRYERMDDWNIQRVNERGDAIIGERGEDFLSPQDYTISLKPTDLSTFMRNSREIYTNPRSIFAHSGMYCFRYLKIDEDDFEIVCIRGTELLLITKETRNVQIFKDYYEMRPSIYKYFSMLDKMEVDRAVENYNEPSVHTQKLKVPNLLIQ